MLSIIDKDKDNPPNAIDRTLVENKAREALWRFSLNAHLLSFPNKVRVGTRPPQFR